MHALSLSALAIFSAALVQALAPLHPADGPAKPDSYIVKLFDGSSQSSHLRSLVDKNNRRTTPHSSIELTHAFGTGIFNGYAADLHGDAIDQIRALPDVEYVVPNTYVTAQSIVTQKDAPWALAEISSANGLGSNPNTGDLNYTYTYDSTGGAGVDIYIIDTGIYVANADFEGRAVWGATFGGYASADGNGHGTFCASLAGGKRWGVAKKAGLVAVKVLSDSGSGSNADVISGINWSVQRASSLKRPAVLTLPLGGSANAAVDSAVAAAINAGYPVIVAAGGSNVDAGTFSPARVPAAITVASSVAGDTKASYSNYGAVVDIWAPGGPVTAAWIGSPTATNSISGTSVSTCYTAGIVAYILGLFPTLTPAQVDAQLHAWGRDGAIKTVPSGTTAEIIYSGVV